MYHFISNEWIIKHFEKGEKNMFFMIKDDSVQTKYNEIWNKIKKTLNMTFHSMPAHDGSLCLHKS